MDALTALQTVCHGTGRGFRVWGLGYGVVNWVSRVAKAYFPYPKPYTPNPAFPVCRGTGSEINPGAI